MAEMNLPEGWKLRIIRAKRKTLSLSVTEKGVIVAKAPMRLPVDEILRFVNAKKGWIEKQAERIERTRERVETEGALSQEEIETLARMAKKVLPERVARFAEILGVSYGRITIRNQRSLWGSCTAEGNLNFNCLLMLAPRDVADYVVVHELCHRLEMNHSQRFWKHVADVIPDYREKRRWLREEGNVIMNRMTGSRYLS